MKEEEGKTLLARSSAGDVAALRLPAIRKNSSSSFHTPRAVIRTRPTEACPEAGFRRIPDAAVTDAGMLSARDLWYIAATLCFLALTNILPVSYTVARYCGLRWH